MADAKKVPTLDEMVDALDYKAICIKLRRLGFWPEGGVLTVGPHKETDWYCKAGWDDPKKGTLTNSSHAWRATPLEAIKAGCPHCKEEV